MISREGTVALDSSVPSSRVLVSVGRQAVRARNNSIAVSRERIASGAGVQSLQTDNHFVSWVGLVYVDGKQAGSNSVKHFLQQLPRGLAAAVEELKGIYFIVLVDRSSGDTYAFTDGSGLLHVFHSADGVSDSFLDLVAHDKLQVSDLSPEALLEFFHFGFLSFGKTFFDSIKRLDPHQIARVDGGGRLTFIPKSTMGSDQPTPTRGFEDLLQSFATSCRQETISVDLTGGIDSRLLAVVLEYLGVPFDLAVSGAPANPDVAIAIEVSKLLNRELYVKQHDITDFEASLPSLFTLGDGLFDLSRCHEPLQLQRERVAREVTLMVAGPGGELFKDFWWLQDFPFYAKRRPNLSRLYSTRITPVEPVHGYLTDRYATIGRRYETWYLEQLRSYVVEGNTQTYDNIYRCVKMADVNGRFVSNHVQLLQCYLPFLEPQIAAVGYRLPRSTRFFNRFHRQTITRYRPDVAALHTTDGGMSVSSKAPLIAGDMGKYVVDKFSRLVRKFGERMFHRRAPQVSTKDSGFDAALRNCAATQKAFEDLRNRGIMRADVGLHDIKDSYLGNVLTLGMLFEHLEQHSKA
jgi:hypothetical protein